MQLIICENCIYKYIYIYILFHTHIHSPFLEVRFKGGVLKSSSGRSVLVPTVRLSQANRQLLGWLLIH